MLLLALLAAPAATQDLLPLEQRALARHAAGDARGAAASLLELAAASAHGDGGLDTVARVEAWATEAARLLRRQPDPMLLDRLDALRVSPLAKAHALLADRVGIAALEAAADHPSGAADERADALGCLRELWLVGPFANERGSGYRSALPPESALDFDAELAGKRRPVRWRLLPPLAGARVLDLQRIVHPHEQSLVYAAVALVADAATTAVLELGCTGSFRVFCNGVEAGAREVDRPFAHDQDAVVLPLAAGANLLLLKLCHEEGHGFLAAMRLRALDGSKLRGVRTSVAKDDLRAGGHAAAPAASATPTPSPPLGGRSHWQIGQATGADALRLAWLWRPRAADGDQDRRDRAAAAAAVAALPDVAATHLLLAEASERYARSAADRDDNDRRRALEQALALAPTHVEALVQLGNLLRSGSRLWRQARALADSALQAHAGEPRALLLRTATLRDEGLGHLADSELTIAAGAADAGLDLLTAGSSVLAERQPRAALALYQRALAHRSTQHDECTVATLLARLGRTDEAIDRLARAVVRDPFARRARLQLAGLHRARNEMEPALALLETWLAIAPDDAEAMVAASRCWRLRNDVADASVQQQALLRSALEVEPNRRDDERYAEFLAAADRGDPNPFYAAFRRDAAECLQADAGPPADASAAKDPLHWILRQRVVRAFGNGTTSVYQHDVVRVLTEDGARQLSSYRLPYWNGEQRARLLACSVFRKDGTVQRPALAGARVRLPDLRPGDVVAIEGRIDDLQPSFFGDYFGYVHSFAAPDGSPVRGNELVVLADPGRDYLCQAQNGAPEPERTTVDGALQFRWRMQDLPRDVPELARPDRKEFEPIVRITTYRDWNHFAAWWWNLIKNQIEVTPAMRTTIARLCDGLSSTEAKIAAIYHFVTTDVRYEAWEFGVHGYKPYSTSVIHERRHGDCKDKALLLCAMLGEIGVPCQPVLIFADPHRSRDDLELAMVQHFNHCIAWLPPADGRPGRFLDGTAVWHPTDTLPDMDQGASVLVVDRGRADLRPVPYTTPAANVDRSEFVFALQPDGGAQLQIDYRPLGNEAVELRAMLGTEPARRHEVLERRLVQTFGKLALGAIDASDPLDLDSPVHLAANATLPEVGQRGPQQWQLPSTWAVDNLQQLASEPDRHTPLLLGVPNGTVATLRYRVPPGWRATDLPAAVVQQSAFGTFSMLWRSDGDQVVVERQLSFTTPRIDPTEHTAFRAFVAAVKAADAQLVLLKKEGGR